MCRPCSVTVYQDLSLNTTSGAKFRRVDGGVIRGEMFFHNHRDLGAVHSDLTATLSLVEAVDTVVGEGRSSEQAPDFALYQNLPNSFSSGTQIRFDLAAISGSTWPSSALLDSGLQPSLTGSAGRAPTSCTGMGEPPRDIRRPAASTCIALRVPP